MKKTFLLLCVVGLQAADVTDQREAEIRGGGGEGKCTIEVEIDDVAEVEIFGRRAQIRTLSGSPAVFRRFVCNQEMPNNPFEFRFQGIDGRGRQTLLRQPGRGPAVVRLEDSKGGRHGYTFDVMWRGASGPWTNNNRPGGGGVFGGGNNGGGWGNNNSGWGQGSGNGWGNGPREINFSGRGNGDYRGSNGQSGRLYDPTVRIDRNGRVDVSFESDQGRLSLSGNVERTQGNRIYARLRGGDVEGTMEIQVDGQNRVRQLSMQDQGRNRYDLRWRD